MTTKPSCIKVVLHPSCKTTFPSSGRFMEIPVGYATKHGVSTTKNNFYCRKALHIFLIMKTCKNKCERWYDTAHIMSDFQNTLIQFCFNYTIDNIFVKFSKSFLAITVYLSVEQMRRVFDDNLRIIFYSSPLKYMLWVLIRIASLRQF